MLSKLTTFKPRIPGPDRLKTI